MSWTIRSFTRAASSPPLDAPNASPRPALPHPDRGFAAFDLYCGRPSVEWPWAERLTGALGPPTTR